MHQTWSERERGNGEQSSRGVGRVGTMAAVNSTERQEPTGEAIIPSCLMYLRPPFSLFGERALTAVQCMGCHFIYNNGRRGRFSWQRVGNRSPKAVRAGPRRSKFDTFSCDVRLLFSWFRWVEGL